MEENKGFNINELVEAIESLQGEDVVLQFGFELQLGKMENGLIPSTIAIAIYKDGYGQDPISDEVLIPIEYIKNMTIIAQDKEARSQLGLDRFVDSLGEIPEE